MSDAANEAEGSPTIDPEYLTYLQNLNKDASRDFDKSILTLSSSAIGVSLAFIDKIAPIPVYEDLMLAAWGLLAASATCTVVSLLTSMDASRAIYLDYTAKREVKARRHGGWTSYLNLGAATLFVVGLICLIVFAFLNLRGP